jgi:hypothetical protein
MSDGIRDAEGKRPTWMELEAKAPHGCVDTKPGYGEDEARVVAESAITELPQSFGKTPDMRHPDTVLLDWLEKRWKQDDDCPIGADADGTFFPLCESGVWDSDLDLRGAIRVAMRAESENGE